MWSDGLGEKAQKETTHTHTRIQTTVDKVPTGWQFLKKFKTELSTCPQTRNRTAQRWKHPEAVGG